MPVCVKKSLVVEVVPGTQPLPLPIKETKDEITPCLQDRIQVEKGTQFQLTQVENKKTSEKGLFRRVV